MMALMDSRSVETVFHTEHARLWRSLFAYSGSREIADDSAAEAFAQALRRGPKLRDPAAWIWRSSFRIAAGLLKSRSAVVLLENVDDRPVHDEPVVHLLSSLATLSPQQRAIVSLRYVGGFDIEHIAEVLDTTAQSVRVQLHRSHKTLRPILEGTP